MPKIVWRPFVGDDAQDGTDIYIQGAVPVGTSTIFPASMPGQVSPLTAARSPVLQQLAMMSVGGSEVQQVNLSLVAGAAATQVDVANVPVLTSCRISFEPYQDLHGYSNPWPAGGGVNKIDVNQLVSYGTTYGLTISFDGDWIVISGEYTATSAVANFRIAQLRDGSAFPVTNFKAFPDSSTSSHMSATPFGLADANKTLTIYITNMTQGETYDLRCKIVGYEGGTAPATWTPYSNICPITGWTGAEAKRADTPGGTPTSIASVTFPTIGGSNVIYGGWVDTETGYGEIEWANIASYNGETLPGVWISDRDVYISGTTPTTGAQVCYALSNPISFTFTPSSLTLQTGTNWVWAEMEAEA